MELMNVHPGEILAEDFLEDMGITPYRLAKSIGVSQTHISKILKGDMGISADMAMRLSKYFGTSTELWLNLQNLYEVRKVQHEKSEIYNKIVPFKEAS